MMMNDIDLARFIKKNGMHFKDYSLDIPMFDRDYEFKITAITSKHIKFQYQFSYFEIFNAKPGTVECTIRRIIDENGKYTFSNPLALSQRCRSKRNLRRVTFSVPVGEFEEDFKISNISQESISIEKSVEFVEFKNPEEGSIAEIVKIQLISFKDLVDMKIESKEQERLEKEQLRIEKEIAMGDKNTTYNQMALVRIAMFKKQRLKWRSYFQTKVYDRMCAFNIVGVGYQAVKLSKKYDFDDIYYSSENSAEGKIKELLDEVIGGSYNDYDEFAYQIKRNSYEFRNSILLLIGEGFVEFNIYYGADYIELERYVRYEHMMSKFENKEDCLETRLKLFIENY